MAILLYISSLLIFSSSVTACKMRVWRSRLYFNIKKGGRSCCHSSSFVFQLCCNDYYCCGVFFLRRLRHTSRSIRSNIITMMAINRPISHAASSGAGLEVGEALGVGVIEGAGVAVGADVAVGDGAVVGAEVAAAAEIVIVAKVIAFNPVESVTLTQL